MTLSRRSFFTGLAATAVTAPSIVRAASLMPVKRMLIVPDVGSRFDAYSSWFEWKTEVGAPWRMVARIADIDSDQARFVRYIVSPIPAAPVPTVWGVCIAENEPA